MTEELADIADRDALLAELARLRSEVGRLEDRIRLLDELAHQDPLLDLPNRRGFMRQLEMLIARVTRHGDSAAMLFVDLDGLKGINDRFGHKAGDEALIHVAELLAGGVRKGDCVARLAGDEFGILLANADEDSARETALRLVERTAQARFTCDGTIVPLSITIGVGAIQANDQPEQVIVRADEAMYSRKHAAPGRAGPPSDRPDNSDRATSDRR